MAIDYVRGGNPRCPSLLLGGLMLICLFLACSWWSLTSQNFELLHQIADLEDQLKIAGDELDKCLVVKNQLEEKSKDLQNGVAQSRVKLEQLQTEGDDMRDTLKQAQEALEMTKKKITSLESSLTFKTTELESLKTLGEAKNKTLEALRTEKKALSAKLSEDEAKLDVLRSAIASLKKKPEDSVVKLLQRGQNQPDDTQGVAVAIDHAAQAQQDENKAEENKGEVPDPALIGPAGDSVDQRELEMADGRA